MHMLCCSGCLRGGPTKTLGPAEDAQLNRSYITVGKHLRAAA
jgi:hypothetical protein